MLDYWDFHSIICLTVDFDCTAYYYCFYIYRGQKSQTGLHYLVVTHQNYFIYFFVTDRWTDSGLRMSPLYIFFSFVFQLDGWRDGRQKLIAPSPSFTSRRLIMCTSPGWLPGWCVGDTARVKRRTEAELEGRYAQLTYSPHPHPQLVRFPCHKAAYCTHKGHPHRCNYAPQGSCNICSSPVFLY